MGVVIRINQTRGGPPGTAAGARPGPMAEAAVAVADLEALLHGLSAGDPDTAARLAPVLDQARTMTGMMQDLVAADALGDSEALLAMLRDLAALNGVPGSVPETDADAIALAAALDTDDDVALAAVLDALGDLNRTLGAHGQTPLGKVLLAAGRSPRRVQMLLDRGARADVATPDGDTPLHMIAGSPRAGDRPDTLEELSAIVALLVAHGGDLEARTRWGWTPLVCAAVEGSALEMQALLAAGADPNVTVDGKGPVIGAGTSLLVLVAHDPAKVALLIDHGADVAASGIAAHLAAELAMEDPTRDTPFWDSLRASRTLVATARHR